MRTFLNVAGMFILGALALIGASLVHDVHNHRRVSPTRTASSGDVPRGTSGSSAAGSPRLQAVAIAANGLARTLSAAAQALDDDRRTDAAVALDGAYRVSDVLRAATDTRARRDAFQLVQAARAALADGEPARAAAIARLAANGAKPSGPEPTRIPANPADYVGAVVLSPDGDQIGNIVGATRDQLRVASGGIRNALGFITLTPGTPSSIAANSVIYGEERAVGATMVIAVGP